jgi:hypothetical protein
VLWANRASDASMSAAVSTQTNGLGSAFYAPTNSYSAFEISRASIARRTRIESHRVRRMEKWTTQGGRPGLRQRIERNTAPAGFADAWRSHSQCEDMGLLPCMRLCRLQETCTRALDRLSFTRGSQRTQKDACSSATGFRLSARRLFVTRGSGRTQRGVPHEVGSHSERAEDRDAIAD